MKKINFTLLVLAVLLSSHAIAQNPQPVDLRIQNILQETHVWCGAAVAQQIILRMRGSRGTPPQCELVSTAFNAHPSYCCQAPGQCLSGISIQRIQWLIAHYGGRWSSVAYPTDPMTVYQTLRSGRAIIMEVQSSPYTTHVVVIRGMEWVSTPRGSQPVLYINDPMEYFTRPVPFDDIARYWRTAIVVN